MNVETLIIENGTVRAVVAPPLGASLLAFQRRIGDDWLDIFLDARRSYVKGRRAYFAMLPWTARMRNQQFLWDEEAEDIPTDPQWTDMFKVDADWHPHGIHGYGPKLPWKVTTRTTDSVSLSLSSADHPSFVYPSACELRLSYRLDGETLKVWAQVRNAGTKAMPVGGGSHPFIPKYLAGCIAPPDLQFNATRWYRPRADEPNEAMPEGPDLPLPAELNFSKARPATEGWDCALGGWDGTATATWAEAGVRLTVQDADLQDPGLLHLWYWPNKGTFAFEPIVNLGDGFNVKARGGRSGTRILSPGTVSEFSHDYTVSLLD